VLNVCVLLQYPLVCPQPLKQKLVFLCVALVTFSYSTIYIVLASNLR